MLDDSATPTRSPVATPASAKRLQTPMGTVHVFVLTGDKTRVQAQLVADMFDHPMFTVALTTVKPPAHMSSDDQEWHRMQWVMSHADRQGISTYIIVKDTSISSAPPSRFAETVQAALQAGKYDVFYLADWQDRCDLQSNRQSLADTTSGIVRTRSPHGLHAVMYTATGGDVLRGNAPMRNGRKFERTEGRSMDEQMTHEIEEGNILAGAASPPLIQYDPASARAPRDYLKTQHCVAHTPMHAPLAQPAPHLDAMMDDVPILPELRPLAPENGSFTDSVRTCGSGWWVWLWLVLLLIVLCVGLAVYLVRRSGLRASRW